ncbi:CBS domain-containing protein [Kosmotoga pacifica]|uniref:CBS domain containing protein n=1 Tax=Kosmotoga pacifica TaxID=1330330 RepID=A0A0G2Z8C4_9BACT|nr:CBS domain-containing protein [Kosmotoga pacifica]AKI97865.1 CBS domain containing protein [Kosmotoga pacifica]
MRVSKWINRAFPVFSSEQSVSDVMKVAEEYNLSTIVVHDDAKKLLGVVKGKQLVEYDSEVKLADIVEEPEYFSYDTDIIEDVVLMLIESHDLVIPVVSEDMTLKGVVTIFDILEALMEFTSMDQKGVRISVILNDRPGALKKVVDLLADHEINILSIVTSPEEDGKKNVIIRTSETDIGEVANILDSNDIEYDSIIEEEGFSD